MHLTNLPGSPILWVAETGHLASESNHYVELQLNEAEEF